MEFKLSFNMDNAAFDDEPSTEAIRILRQVSARVGMGETEGSIFDINGNRVGQWSIKKE